jgi:butyryl-CoA dehydrogenase
MSFVPTKEQKLIQQSVRDFAKRSLKPIAAELDRTGEYPADVVRVMAENDFLGLFVPATLGGTEAGYSSYLLVVEELARVCAALASILINHSAAVYALLRWGSPAQQQTYLPLLASGESLGALAVHEEGPAVGTGPQAVIATPFPPQHAQERRVPGTPFASGYRLKGRKTFVGNAGKANIYVVLARGAESPGLIAFLVDAKTPGLGIGPSRTGMGLRGCPVADLLLDDVAVSEASLLGAPDQGEVIAEETLAATAVAEAAQTVGIMQTALDEAAKYARQRVQFGQPIANFEAVQGLLAEAITNCHLARLAAYDAARLIADGQPFLREAAMVKWFCSRIGPSGLVNAIQVEGGFGYSEEAPLARLYRDVWGTSILEPPADFPERVIVGGRR